MSFAEREGGPDRAGERGGCPVGFGSGCVDEHELALHHLREAADAADPGARPLLLLHGLGDRSPVAVPDDVAAWPGPIAALDFTGHGDSTRS